MAATKMCLVVLWAIVCALISYEFIQDAAKAGGSTQAWAGREAVGVDDTTDVYMNCTYANINRCLTTNSQ